jgi:hypothetical protein
MSLLPLAGAFLLFVGLIWSVHRLDVYALARYGYAPFALTNLLFMLIPHGLLILAIEGFEPRELYVTLAGAGTLAVLLLVRARTNGWIALLAAPLQLAAAPVLIFSALFRRLAGEAEGS